MCWPRWIYEDYDLLLQQIKLWSLEDPDTGCWIWRNYWDKRNRYPTMMIDGERWNLSRLVLLRKHGHQEPVARHTCDTPACLNPEHLVWGTYADNARDRVERGRSLPGDLNPSRQHPERLVRGEKHGRSRLTEAKVRQIRQDHEAGVSGYALAQQHEVTKRTIQMIVRCQTWKHVLSID